MNQNNQTCAQHEGQQISSICIQSDCKNPQTRVGCPVCFDESENGSLHRGHKQITLYSLSKIAKSYLPSEDSSSSSKQCQEILEKVQKQKNIMDQKFVGIFKNIRIYFDQHESENISQLINKETQQIDLSDMDSFNQKINQLIEKQFSFNNNDNNNEKSEIEALENQKIEELYSKMQKIDNLIQETLEFSTQIFEKKQQKKITAKFHLIKDDKLYIQEEIDIFDPKEEVQDLKKRLIEKNRMLKSFIEKSFLIGGQKTVDYKTLEDYSIMENPQIKCLYYTEEYENEKNLGYHIYVKTLTGKTVTLQCDKDNKIDNIFKSLQIQHQFPRTFRSRLDFAGRNLDPNYSLGSYNIQSGSTLFYMA